MSLPSIRVVAENFGITITRATREQMEKILVEAMRCDLPLAVDRLHALAHAAMKSGATEHLIEDPNSPLGKQLTRVFAGTVLREIAQTYFCHGMNLAFLNCCSPVMGPGALDMTALMKMQIELQDGTLAHADC